MKLNLNRVAKFILIMNINMTALAAPSAREMKACKVKADCVLTAGDCCGCDADGVGVAINKKFVKQWIQALKCDLEEVCSLAESTHWTCKSSKIECIKNECKLVELGK